MWVAAMRAQRRVNALLKKLQTIQRLIRPDGRAEYALKYFGAHCLPGDAEVLTKQGWVRLDAWDECEIAQWAEDGTIRFLPAFQNKFAVEETGVVIDAPHVKGVFTAGHTIPFFSKRGKFQTAAAGDACRLAQVRIPVAGLLQEEAGAITVEQMRVLVAAQADGHWLPLREGGLRFRFVKERKKERISFVLQEAGIKFRVNIFPSEPVVSVVSVSEKDCPVWLTRDRKVFGPWLLQLDAGARFDFLDEVFLWDGTVDKNGTRSYSSCVKQNVEWLATMCHLSGSSMSVKSRAKGNVLWRDLHSGIIRKDSIADVRKKHWKLGDKLSEVFCPTTQTGYWMYRMGGQIAITGNTARWSGGKGEQDRSTSKKAGGSDWNPQNLPQKEMFGKGWWEESGKQLLGDLVNLDDQDDFGVDLRKCIIPAEGCHFVPADLSQIEPRVLWWFAGMVAALKEVGKGISPYEVHGRQTMGYNLAQPMKKGDPAAYRLAKARVLALGYGAGWLKFITMARMYEAEAVFDEPVSEADVKCFDAYLKKCKNVIWLGMWKSANEKTRQTYVNSWKIVTAFRESNPLIRALWYRLGDKLKEAAQRQEDFEIELPSGRSIKYRKIAAQEGDITGVIIRSGRPERHRLYGGLLCENLVQAAARDVFAEGLLRLDDAGYPVAVHIHDEAVCEVPLAVEAQDVAKVLAQAPLWMADLPVEAEAESTPYYTK